MPFFGSGNSPASVLHGTISEYIRKEEENILRKRRLLALLMDKGRVRYNCSGNKLEWSVRMKRLPMTQSGHFPNYSFAQYDLRENAALDYRVYAVTAAVEKFSELKNRGQAAIIKVFADLTKDMLKDIREKFCDELYIDGNATGNTRRIHGLESWFGTSGANANGFIGTPSDTYAELTTGLGDYGGSWTGNWPLGSGDTEYDFWSPIIVDYTDTAWAAATKTWANTAVEAMRYGIIRTQRSSEQVDMILLDGELYRQWLHSMDDKERIQVTAGRGKGRLANLGFGEVQSFDGVEVSWEYGVPANVGYGLTMADLELCSMQAQMFVPSTPDFDLPSTTKRYLLDFYGNLKSNPRGHFKLLAIT